MHTQTDTAPRAGLAWLFSWLVHSPQAAMGMLTLLTGHSVYVGATYIDIVANLVLLALAVAALRVVVLCLPDIWRLIFIFAMCGVISMLTMGWCISNEDVCRADFARVKNAALHVWTTTSTFSHELYNSTRRHPPSAPTKEV